MTPSREPWERRALVLILLVGAFLRCIDLNDPWHWGTSADPDGAGFKNVFGAAATGLLVRNFHEDGFSDSGWMPYYYRIPFRDGGSAELWYTHHPTGWTVLSTWMMQAFGPHEWTQRLPAALCSILSIEPEVSIVEKSRCNTKYEFRVGVGFRPI